LSTSQNVVPALGAVLAIFMAASPTRTVWRTRRRKDIGGEGVVLFQCPIN